MLCPGNWSGDVWEISDNCSGDFRERAQQEEECWQAGLQTDKPTGAVCMLVFSALPA